MRAISYGSAFGFLSMLTFVCGCTVQTDAYTVAKSVVMPGEGSRQSVLYLAAGAPECMTIASRVRQVIESPDVESPATGLAARDLRDEIAPYRAYFIPSHVVGPTDAAFVFCHGDQPALLPLQCMLVGINEKGCFHSGVYGIADEAGIRTTVEAIRLQWPDELRRRSDKPR